MNKVQVTTKAQLDELYNDSALTIEGFSDDDANLSDLSHWIKRYSPIKQETFYIIKGKTMNEQYWLTGKNAYRKNITLVAIKLSDIEKPAEIILPRYNIGGRWFDDIVDNNARREKVKA